MTSISLPRQAPPDPAQLRRCLLLAVLLHVWLVLVFGNATGTAEPGQGVWGSLTVRLLGRSAGEPDAPPGEPTPAWRDNGAPGTAPRPRQGGQVRPSESSATQTGAAELGRWNPVEVPPDAAGTDEVSPAPPSQPKPATLDLPQQAQPAERVERVDLAPQQPPPRLTRSESALLPLAPAESLRARPPTALPAPSTDLPAPVSRLETPEGTLRPLPRAPDLRATSRPLAQPEAPPAELPAPVRRLEAPERAVAPLQRANELQPPGPSPANANANAAALPQASGLPAPVRRLEPGDDALAPLSRAQGLRSAAPAPTAPAAPPADLPAAVQRLEASGSPVTPLSRAPDTRLGAAPAGAATTVPDLSTALPAPVAAPVRGDADGFTAPRASAGSPDAGSRLGRDLATPPSASASAPRAPLNLSLPRSGAIAARRSPGLLELLPQPPEQKSKLERDLEKAGKDDCRKAYANAGILAIVPLAIDAARDKSGCKW